MTGHTLVPMNVAVFGATGFLGKRLIRKIIHDKDWTVTAVARDPSKLSGVFDDQPRVSVIRGDVTSYENTKNILSKHDAAYYLVHMMGHKDVDFVEAELSAARTFAKAMNATNVKRVVFMGGLGDNAESESKHLLSRHRTGEILRNASNNVVELRASMIVAEGSVAYDIIKNVTDTLPVMVLPAIADTLTQPIAADDALEYLVQAATIETNESIAVDIGGPKAMSYADVYRTYAKSIGKHPRVVKLPFIPAPASAFFLNLITPKIHARIGAIMVESMTAPMVVSNDLAKDYFPTVSPMSLEEAFKRV